MLKKVALENVLVLDIETVPAVSKFEDLTDKQKTLWEKKTSWQRKEGETPASFYSRAGIYAEFGKVICISAGAFTTNGDDYVLRIKSFSGKDEKEVLRGFAGLLQKHYRNLNKHHLCGHNIREFDIPFICRRMLVNGLNLPMQLDISGAKPWQVEHLLDTLTLWKFGDYKHFTSLDLLADLFDIPTPKDDIDGSEVARVFYEEGDLDRITNYCEKDVLTVAQLLLRFQGRPLLEEKQVTVVEEGASNKN